jgi:hypothetical protein
LHHLAIIETSQLLLRRGGSALTDAPVVSFTTLLLRATQHAIRRGGWRLLYFSHRGAYPHLKDSFAGHTQKVWQNTGLTL